MSQTAAKATKPASATVLTCTHCKANLPDKAQFCTNCGKSVAPPHNPFCANCGKQADEQHDRFCSACGCTLKIPWYTKIDLRREMAIDQGLLLSSYVLCSNLAYDGLFCRQEIRAYERGQYAGSLMRPQEWWDELLALPGKYDTHFLRYGTGGMYTTEWHEEEEAIARRTLMRYFIAEAIRREYLNRDGTYSPLVKKYYQDMWHFSDTELEVLQFTYSFAYHGPFVSAEFPSAFCWEDIQQGEENLYTIARNAHAYEEDLYMRWQLINAGKPQRTYRLYAPRVQPERASVTVVDAQTSLYRTLGKYNLLSD